jgi:hypothetical protein
LREFFIQGRKVIEIPLENTEFIHLYNKNILLISSKNVRKFVYGSFVSVCINPIIEKYITPEILQLPDGELTHQEIEKIKMDRPLFVSQINYVNNLFNFRWLRR